VKETVIEKMVWYGLINSYLWEMSHKTQKW
jgi:hypothetical protein